MSSFSAGSVSLDRREAEEQGQGQNPPGPEATALDKGSCKRVSVKPPKRFL